MYTVDNVELRKRMIDKGLNTIQQMADACGLSRDTMSDIVNGRVRPGAMAIYAIAAVLDLEPEVLGRIFFKKIVA